MQSLENWQLILGQFAEKIIILLFFTLIFYLTFYLFKGILKRLRNYSPNTVNGVILLIDLIELGLWILIAFLYLDVDPAILLGGSALLVTVVGLSSSSFGANIVGGLYIILTHPYGIGDLINYNNNIGVVMEIGLNHTKILRLNRKIVSIPNGVMINTNIQNFNVSSKYVKRENKRKTQPIMTREKSFPSEIINITQKITIPIIDTLNQDEVIRLSFPIELRLDEMKQPVNIKETIDTLEKVLMEFTPNFGFELEFYIMDFSFRLNVIIIITSKSPKTIFDTHPLIIEKITKKFFDFQQL